MRKYTSSWWQRLPYFVFFVSYSLFLPSCSIQKQIAKSAKEVLTDEALKNAHVGISIYDPTANQYWYNYNGDKYFVPASNTKLATCYAAMKHLGDSLPGLKYKYRGDEICYFPTGDPTLMHPDFATNPVIDFLKTQKEVPGFICDQHWKEKRFGYGWSWSDYSESYMCERSSFPIYGNLFKIYWNENDSLIIYPNWEPPSQQFTAKSSTELLQQGYPINPRTKKDFPKTFTLQREENYNGFDVIPSSSAFTTMEVPIWNANDLTYAFLEKILGYRISPIFCPCTEYTTKIIDQKELHVIYSHPTDSLLKPMMHRSDNFFAEQALLMVSNEMLNVMNDEFVIDSLLYTDFKDLPQKPRWVDGSGLSRYNLFTPQDFVYILNKMKNEFGIERMKNILPTGGEGTLSNYYKESKGFIYAKTGSLSGILALSGYLYTKKGKLLVFSTLINNHFSSASTIRRKIENFLSKIRKKY